MTIYVGLILGAIIFAWIFRGTVPQNKKYIIFAVGMLFLVLALRDIRVGSDLGRYQTHYTTCSTLSWPRVFDMYEWNCIGFYCLNKIHSMIFGYNYHSFLALLAIFEGTVIAYFIYKLSVNPMLSIILYMAMGYYAFAFSGLKQALAITFIMLAMIAITEQKLLRFIVLTCVAASIHLPAIIFIFAYFIAKLELNKRKLFLWVGFLVVMFAFRGQIAALLSDMYDSPVEMTGISGIGGKALMMTLFVLLGFIFRTPSKLHPTYQACFNFMLIAVALQYLAVYGNVFERLADYYFIFFVLYIPLVFQRVEEWEPNEKSYFKISSNSRWIMDSVIVVVLVFYFYLTTSATPGIVPYSMY